MNKVLSLVPLLALASCGGPSMSGRIWAQNPSPKTSDQRVSSNADARCREHETYAETAIDKGEYGQAGKAIEAMREGDCTRTRHVEEDMLVAKLVGSWRAEGTGFEEILFEGNFVFSTHLHAKPFNVGSWRIEKSQQGSRLILLVDGDEQLRYEISRVEKNALEGKIGAVDARWERIPKD